MLARRGLANKIAIFHGVWQAKQGLALLNENCYIFTMKSAEVRKRFLQFFEKRGHVIIPSASLVPENDPTTLFTGSGMQPLLPYLLGAPHPAGTRIANSQKCFRSEDIEEVGDNRHTTFFEMLGNWSLGDPSTGVKGGYWKEEQLGWLFEFLTKDLGIAKERLWVSCFQGDGELGLPKDTESAEIWEKLGLPKERIIFYDAKKNWWSRSGAPENMPIGEPGGPDSEIFFDFGIERGLHEKSAWKDNECHPNCDCGRFMEIGNSVFMEYQKTPQGFVKLKQRNVDFGGGLERITAAVNDEPDIFEIDLFSRVVKDLESHVDKQYKDISNQRSYRIVLDHIRSVVFLISDAVTPSNTEKGYFVRRLIRRAILHIDKLKMKDGQLVDILDSIIIEYKDHYSDIFDNKKIIEQTLHLESQQFRKTLTDGLKEFTKISEGKTNITSGQAFKLFSSHGLPIDMIIDLAKERGLSVDVAGFEEEFKKHQEISRSGSEKKFKGGLADTSEMSVKYHTATHLLHQALHDVLGEGVSQKGSNITPERLRFDFSFPRKMTDKEKNKVEEIVNEKIKEALPVNMVVLPIAEAERTGAKHSFTEKYGNEVSVYFVGDIIDAAYSKEFCGGPHVKNTLELRGPEGKWLFKITKEEAVSQGIRRIKAILL